MPARKLAAAVALVLPALAAFPLGGEPMLAATPAAASRVAISGIYSLPNDQVCAVATIQPLPAAPLDVSNLHATAGNTTLPVTMTPVLSFRTAVSVVVDASTAGADALQRSGLSGVTNLLLQLPPESRTAVIADRRPPMVVAPPGQGIAADLDALEALRPDGDRATSDALALAVRQLPPAEAFSSVVVLYTGASDAGGPTAAALGQRLRQAHAVLAVADTSRDPQYWRDVSTLTGGLDLHIQAGDAIPAFDALADALRARYKVIFPRPTGAIDRVDLRFTVGGQQLTTAVSLPASTQTSVAPQGSGVTMWWWVLALAGAVGGALVVAVRQGRTRGSRRTRQGVDWSAEDRNLPTPQPMAASAGTGPNLDPNSSPSLGVRVFDIAGSATPREITNTFWEHAARDASQDPPEAAAPEEPERDPDTKPMVSPPRWPEAPQPPASSWKSTGEHGD